MPDVSELIQELEWYRNQVIPDMQPEHVDALIALLKAQGEEIAFLKHMQRQMVQGIDNQTLGEMVERAVKGE